MKIYHANATHSFNVEFAKEYGYALRLTEAL